MQNVSVRIERILIENLKNVEHGEIALSNSRRPDGASMLGIFGQNGSGKSTLVDVLEMTKTCVMGRRLPHRWANLVNVDAEYGSVECEFSITRPEDDETCTAIYTFKIRSEEDVSSEADGDEDADESSEQRMEVFEDEPPGSSGEDLR